MLRTRVERVLSMPCNGGVLHDEESGDNPVVWVEKRRITKHGAQQLEDDINRATLRKGRRLTVPEVLAWTRLYIV